MGCIDCAGRSIDDVLAEVGHPYHEPVWMLELTIGQLQHELEWVEQILKDANRRAPAKHSRKK